MNARKVVTEYRLAKWQEILKAKPESGLSVEAYCRSIGVSSFQYYYWQKKLRAPTLFVTVHTVATMALEASPSEQSNNEMFVKQT